MEPSNFKLGQRLEGNFLHLWHFTREYEICLDALMHVEIGCYYGKHYML